MGGESGTYWGENKCLWDFVEKSEGENFKNLCTDERIILKLTLKKRAGGVERINLDQDTD